jgi:hypothetical protein
MLPTKNDLSFFGHLIEEIHIETLPHSFAALLGIDVAPTEFALTATIQVALILETPGSFAQRNFLPGTIKSNMQTRVANCFKVRPKASTIRVLPQ